MRAGWEWAGVVRAPRVPRTVQTAIAHLNRTSYHPFCRQRDKPEAFCEMLIPRFMNIGEGRPKWAPELKWATPITANLANPTEKILTLESIARGHHRMLCMRSAAQNQAVSHITVILAFLIKHLTPLSSPICVNC